MIRLFFTAIFFIFSLSYSVLYAQISGQGAAGASIADVSERIIESVVNIKASQKVTRRNVPMPQVPPGSPFEDLFNDFFNREGGDGRQPQRSSSLGSGFIIDASGLIVTNYHVISEASDIKVVFNNGDEIKAEIVGKDAKTDLALLKVKTDKTLRAVSFGDSDKMRIGESVIAIGNPYGFGGSVSAGIISAKQRNIRSGPYDSFIQTDAAINKGNSGGPLFNLAGEVIGINTAIVSPTGGSIGIGFAVPSSLASPVIDQLKQFGETRRAWLGVSIQELDEDTADALKLGKPRGAMVISIDEKGPAKVAGFEREDVILKFEGKEIRHSNDLPRLVAQAPIGKEVELIVFRKGKEIAKKVTLARMEESNTSSKSDNKDGNNKSENHISGLDITSLNPENRRKYRIKDNVEGVLVTQVDPDSVAAERQINRGDVIVEIQREQVKSVADVSKRIEALKAQGQKRALLYVSTGGDGALRYVTLPIE